MDFYYVIKNISFYKKYGWLKNNNINVKNKIIENNLFKMIYNNNNNNNIIIY